MDGWMDGGGGGGGHDSSEVLLQHLPGGNEEYHEVLHLGRPVSGIKSTTI